MRFKHVRSVKWVVSVCVILCGLFTYAAIAQDDLSCRDRLVACVSESGDVLGCRSTYTNCEAEAGNDIVKRASTTASSGNERLIFEPEIIRISDTMSAVRLFVSNTTAQGIKVANVTYPVTCADGTRDRAVFFMDGLIPAGTDRQSVGANQLVCLGINGAIQLHDDDAISEGLASTQPTLEYDYPCADGERQWLVVTQEPTGVVRWRNRQGISGALNRGVIFDNDFAGAACSPLKPPSTDVIHEVRRTLNQWLSEPTAGTLILRHSVTGVRN